MGDDVMAQAHGGLGGGQAIGVAGPRIGAGGDDLFHRVQVIGLDGGEQGAGAAVLSLGAGRADHNGGPQAQGQGRRADRGASCNRLI